MAGKKDKAVTAKIANLTDKQAADLVAEIIKAKDKVAPLSRGTIAKDNEGNIGAMLQGKRTKKITTSKK